MTRAVTPEPLAAYVGEPQLHLGGSESIVDWNMQPVADRLLDVMAAHPGKIAFARSARAFTKGVERGAAQQVAPQLRAAAQYANTEDSSQQ
jgi:hypothetical protein